MMIEMILISPLEKFLLASWTNYENEWTGGFDTISGERMFVCSVSDTVIMWFVIILLLCVRPSHIIFIDFFLITTRYSNFIRNKEDQHKFFKTRE